LKSRFRQLLSILLALLLSMMPTGVMSHYLLDGYSDYRADIGLKLFRSLLSSDLKIAGKTDDNNQLCIVILYLNSPSATTDYQDQLAALLPDFAGVTTTIRLMSLQQFLQRSEKVAGLYLAQQLNADELQAVVNKAISQQFVVFSPFEGDVEQGVLAGISVQASVRPYINQKTLKASSLQIKDFYLKAARLYE
jgi:hypothetical protein